MKAIVIGGGVAGAAAATALRRTGAEVTVYEAYEDPAGAVGSFVSLATNGLRALETLGCLPAVQEAGFAVERQRMWSGRGRLLGDVPRSRRPQEPLRSVTVMRGNLVAALRGRAAAAGARIETGRRLGPDEIRQVAADPAVDVVVGADGIWSATRKVVDPAAPDPRYGGTYHVSGVSHGLGMEPGAFNMIFGRNGAFVYLPAPDGTVWWSAQVSAPRPPEDVHAVGVARLAELYRGEEQALTVLRAADGVRSATVDHVLDPVDRHRDGRIVLIGDAAHPVGAGQGASMAVEDAVVLARALRAVPAGRPVQDALAAYDRERRDRTGKLAKTAAANRDAKTAGPVAARLRDLIMPLFFSRLYPRATDWLYTYDAGALTD